MKAVRSETPGPAVRATEASGETSPEMLSERRCILALIDDLARLAAELHVEGRLSTPTAPESSKEHADEAP
jgi:hypothetical protein